MSVRKLTFEILDSLPEGNYFGRQITEMVWARTIKRPYDSTVIGYARDYADLT